MYIKKKNDYFVRVSKLSADRLKDYYLILELIDQHKIEFNAYGWYSNRIEVNVINQVFNKKELSLDIQMNYWKIGQNQAVAMMLAEMIHSRELRYTLSLDFRLS